MGSLLESVYMYCERTGGGLLAEPLNAVTNLAFFIAAWFLWQDYLATRKKRDEERVTLVILTVLIGIGSTLFHTTATRLGMYADIIPIGFFVVFYLYVCMRRFFSLSLFQTLGALAMFGLASYLTAQISDPNHIFNGSQSYFPCLAAIALIGWRLHLNDHPSAPNFIKATLALAASLTFRTVDMRLCPTLAFGTHFLWHLLNGLVLYLLVKAIPERRQKLRE